MTIHDDYDDSKIEPNTGALKPHQASVALQGLKLSICQENLLTDGTYSLRQQTLVMFLIKIKKTK